MTTVSFSYSEENHRWDCTSDGKVEWFVNNEHRGTWGYWKWDSDHESVSFQQLHNSHRNLWSPETDTIGVGKVFTEAYLQTITARLLD